MTVRYLIGIAIGAAVMFAALESQASVPKGGKFERRAPASCWLFCANGTAETVGNENTAPSGESFSSPTGSGDGLSLGDLANTDRYPVWIRRTVTAGAAAVASDTFTLRVGYDYVP